MITHRNDRRERRLYFEKALLEDVDDARKEEFEYVGDDAEQRKYLREVVLSSERRYRSAVTVGLQEEAAYWAIEIPEDKYESLWAGEELKASLSEHGIAWTRYAITQARMNRAKDWSAIVMPILSLLSSTAIAILGLLVALKKK